MNIFFIESKRKESLINRYCKAMQHYVDIVKFDFEFDENEFRETIKLRKLEVLEKDYKIIKAAIRKLENNMHVNIYFDKTI